MQTLIELPLLRKIKIIQKLVSSQDGMSEKEIALFNNCSISTARNDVEEISKEYRETFGVNTSNGSLKFSKVSIPETSLVIRALFSESLNIQLLLEIFDHPYQNRRHYCKATAISEASFYRALKSINQVIEAYGFSIKYQEGGYFLQAHSEEELRSFIVSLYTETKTIEECFIRIPFDDLKNLVSQYFLGDDTMNCDVYTSYYSYFAYVSLIRKLQGFTINNKKSSKIYP